MSRAANRPPTVNVPSDEMSGKAKIRADLWRHRRARALTDDEA
jgi:hypothetical protein